MCLQEVEEQHYNEWYLPQLKSKGNKFLDEIDR